MFTTGWILWHLVRQKPAECSLAAANGRSVVMVRPSRTDNLSVDGVLQEVSPKILGAWNLCRALQGRPLKQFVAISSLVVDHSSIFSLVLPGQHAAIAPNCQPIPSDIRPRKGCRLRLQAAQTQRSLLVERAIGLLRDWR